MSHETNVMMQTNETATGSIVAAHVSAAADRADAPARTVTIITGDRLCTHCGYNLTGQTVMREPEYGLLIARCPECAQVACVTEYPLLGKWANRWAAMLAALYLLIVLIMLGATVGPVIGISYAAGEVAGEGMSMHIDNEIDAWIASQAAGGAPAGAQTIVAPGMTPAPATTTDPAMMGPFPPGTPIPPAMPLGASSVMVTPTGQVIINSPQTAASFQQWWAQQSRSALLGRAGGWWNAINREALYLWIPLGIIGFVAGCMWSIIALRRGVVGRFVIALLLIALLASFGLIPFLTWLWGEPYSSWRAGAYVVGPRMIVCCITFTALCLLAGLFCGRSIVRGMVRLFLPPRLRSSLAILWTTDGRTPPITS